MKVQLLSDLHIEFQDHTYQSCGCDVVVLAGDIHTKAKGIEWALKNITDRPVIYVLGNHEFWGKAHPRFISEARALTKETNIHILENDVISIGEVNFFGATFWTDFEIFGDPQIAGYECQQIMNDYKKIRRSPTFSKLRSIDTATIHARSKAWLCEALREKKGETNVVITHHGPSIRSVAEGKRHEKTVPAYVSALNEFISEYEPDYWFHGHLHNSSEYNINQCTVVCNPKGYPGSENPIFDPMKCIQIP